MIEFERISDKAPAIEYLTAKIGGCLKQDGGVLWLIAGGSALDIAIHTANNLKGCPNLSKLTVSLTDERYGPVGHSDSNWKQLIDKGFDLPEANMRPVLIDKDMGHTVSAYEDFLENEIAAADFSIALAGMGADGHIFGIKPGSPSVASHQGVVGYDWDDYRRITPTINIIKRLDEVVFYAVGNDKHAQIDKLATNKTAQDQPAQLLKQMKRVVFFNDYKGGQI